MSVTMNVTHTEFADIWRACNEFYDETDVATYMERYYGCERYTSYAVVVHRRAPAIPMMSWNLPRFENGPTSCEADDCHTEAIKPEFVFPSEAEK